MKMHPTLRRALDWLRSAARRFWAILSRRFWTKLLSFILAIILWNYVINSNTSITRSKTITGVNGYITGQSTLSTYGLALLTDPSELIDDVTVRLEVAQAVYSQASTQNVQVTLDLSNVRTAGTQQVPLRASSNYGRVSSILPASVALTFEPLDSRLLPVNVEASGTRRADYWYNVGRSNPSAITVTGAASVVRSLSQARVYSDVSDATEGYYRAEPFVLLDGAGNEVSSYMLNSSVSSISVTMDIYPTKELPISVAPENVVSGRVADGYTITDISIQPQSVTVAADQGLLAGISELRIEPVSVDERSQSFSARASLSRLSDFKNVSAEQVYVNVSIAEEDVSAWVSDNTLTFVGKADDLQLDWQDSDIQVYVTGPKSTVEALQADGIPITVDLTNLTAGSYACPLRFPSENYPDVSFEPETNEVRVTLIEAPAD